MGLLTSLYESQTSLHFLWSLHRCYSQIFISFTFMLKFTGVSQCSWHNERIDTVWLKNFLPSFSALTFLLYHIFSFVLWQCILMTMANFVQLWTFKNLTAQVVGKIIHHFEGLGWTKKNQSAKYFFTTLMNIAA